MGTKALIFCSTALGLSVAAGIWTDSYMREQSEQAERKSADEEFLQSWTPSQIAEGRPCVTRPYAVTLCGIFDEVDFDRAIRDAKTRALYGEAHFDSSEQVVSQGMLVYASYRKDSRVAWTSYRIRIPLGESLFVVDAARGLYLRKGCGNLLSTNPQRPTSPNEPNQAILESPDQSILPSPTFEQPEVNLPGLQSDLFPVFSPVLVEQVPTVSAPLDTALVFGDTTLPAVASGASDDSLVPWGSRAWWTFPWFVPAAVFVATRGGGAPTAVAVPEPAGWKLIGVILVGLIVLYLAQVMRRRNG